MTAQTPAHPDASPGNRLFIARLQSIDLLRGVIMVLMAIDHVRVYSGIPSGGKEPGIFFTRWITHFCVSGFTFFAGLGIFLYSEKIRDKGRLSRYLLSRGLLLVLLELTVIRWLWTFNLDFRDFMLAGVIWMLGWCMVLMAALTRLRPLAVGITGLCIIAFQQVFQYLPQALPATLRPSFTWFWDFIYPSGSEDHAGISVLYVIVPWIGVMAAGYGFGKIITMPPVRRKKLCMGIGLSAIALFLVAGSILILSQPSHPDAPPFLFRLLNQRKYPASPLFLLMTLGPLIALIPFAEKMTGGLAKVFTVFGRVPLFYYVLHIGLIHISALLVNYSREGSPHQEWYRTAPFTWIPKEHAWSLPLLYLVFIVDVSLLFFLSRWYVRYKFAHPEKKWLKYL